MKVNHRENTENFGNGNPRGIYAAPQMQAALGLWLPQGTGQIPDGGDRILPDPLSRFISPACAEARRGSSSHRRKMQ